MQAKILPITEKQNAYAKKLAAELEEKGVRVVVDDRNEKIGYKIREAQMDKVPYMLVVGEKEAESGTVSVRRRDKGDTGAVSAEEFASAILKEIAEKTAFCEGVLRKIFEKIFWPMISKQSRQIRNPRIPNFWKCGEKKMY